MAEATCSRMCQHSAQVHRCLRSHAVGALCLRAAALTPLLFSRRVVWCGGSINVRCGVSEERMLTTGLHTVCDVSCAECEGSLGWKYVRAHESSQKYKEGKYILEKQFIDKHTAR